MNKKPSVNIEPKGLRVEFRGSNAPSHLVIPILLGIGEHKEICIKIYPRVGVRLTNSVYVGDALQETFSRQHTISGGGSFFAEASYSHTSGIDKKRYEVVWLPDFQGIKFILENYKVEQEPIGLQLAFPIVEYLLKNESDYFAKVHLEIKGERTETHIIPRIVHPNAGRILLLSGYSPDLYTKIFRHPPVSELENFRSMYLTTTKLQFFSLADLHHLLELKMDGIHFYTNVDFQGVLIEDKSMPYESFFEGITGYGLKFVYLDTCNSVQVVSTFRKSDIGALIAATENLYEPYANRFEKSFYQKLGEGSSISQAFEYATAKHSRRIDTVYPTRSGTYNPMFLDLRVDSSFSPSNNYP